MVNKNFWICKNQKFVFLNYKQKNKLGEIILT